DHPVIRQQFVRRQNETDEVILVLDGIRCAGCVQAIEKRLTQLPGLYSIQINYASHRAILKWDNRLTDLCTILQEIEKLGYSAWPDHPAQPHQQLERSCKFLLRRLGVAGVLGMQIMMFSIALYAGDATGMEPEFQQLFSWLCLLLCLPLLAYAAQPFFQGAWQQLSNHYAGMDVPVALALSLAFAGSIWTLFSNTWLDSYGVGQIYFDSIAMFVFFLLASRFVEMRARLRGMQHADAMDQKLPQLATRLLAGQDDWHTERIVATALQPGDQVLVKPGETVPADGRLLDDFAHLDESLLSGESRPCRKTSGSPIVGGSVNLGNPLWMEVTKTGSNTVLAHILHLMAQAHSEKPQISLLTEKVAGRFVFCVLLLATGVASHWWLAAPERWLEVTLSVLVVTCPCALSLATPSAMTAASNMLTRSGLLVMHGHALETLTYATHVIFDKTGTLTTGHLQLEKTVCPGSLNERDCLCLAASLEQYSEHPIGRVLAQAIKQHEIMAVTGVKNQSGSGLSGNIEGRTYWLGSARFIRLQTGLDIPVTQNSSQTLAVLATHNEVLAIFHLQDELRPEAFELTAQLQAQGKNILLYSGDRPEAVEHIAKQLQLSQGSWAGALRPEDKLARLTALQKRGAVVVMIGDGINDTPVLAKAQVSVAMGGGPDIARRQADIVLLDHKFKNLLDGFVLADKTLSIIRQNICWALGYNMLAQPIAAIGRASMLYPKA
ncbi:MAG: cation-translocating P-type ATPase, partial [Pseudomonadota bacterium]